MAFNRRQLTTIYSVGEGRTIVFATDGCDHCLAAFSILVRTAPGHARKPPPQQTQEPLARRHQSMPRHLEPQTSKNGRLSWESKLAPNTPIPSSWSSEDPTDKKGSRRRTPQLNLGELDSVLDLARHRPSKALTAFARQDDGSHSPPESLVILDPIASEDEGEQDLTLKGSDRLILALFSPPWLIPDDSPDTHPHQQLLPSQHQASPESGGAKGRLTLSAPHLSLGALLGKKKTGLPLKSPKSSGKKEGTKKKGSDDNSPQGKADPKEGPGHTTIFMPQAELEDVEKTLEKAYARKDRDCLTRFLQAAREHQVRFEAIKVEGQHCPEAEEGEEDALQLQQVLGSRRKHLMGLGFSLCQFCEGVDAGILVLGCTHSSSVAGTSEGFSRLLVDYCCRHCESSVRMLSDNQLLSYSHHTPDSGTP